MKKTNLIINLFILLTVALLQACSSTSSEYKKIETMHIDVGDHIYAITKDAKNIELVVISMTDNLIIGEEAQVAKQNIAAIYIKKNVPGALAEAGLDSIKLVGYSVVGYIMLGVVVLLIIAVAG